MGWFAIIAAIIQYGPEIIAMVKTLIDAIRSKNAAKGASAVSEAGNLATQIVASLNARNDMTNDQKREQAFKDLITGMQGFGVTLSETNARTLTQLAYQHLSGK